MVELLPLKEKVVGSNPTGRTMLKLSTPLDSIDGIARFIKKLHKLEIKTVHDLLRHFPARYDDFSQIYKISELQPNQHATVQGVVEDIDLRKSWRRRMFIVEAVIADETGSIRAVWFNQPYIKYSLRRGVRANFAGKVSEEDGEWYFSNPAYEVIKGGELKHTGRLIPIYPETRGLTSKGLRFLIKALLDRAEKSREFIPKEILGEYRLPEINRALNDVHFPGALGDALKAKRRFAFEELFVLQLFNLRQKKKLSEYRAPQLKADIEQVKNWIASLPFELTRAQKRSLWEIIQDLERPRPMNRLMQGDVGSGKTVVAALAALIAAQNGCQTAFMAPTEVLARQHFETLKKLFFPFDQKVNLGFIASGSAKIFWSDDIEAEVKKTELRKQVANGKAQIVIGTHALIQKNVDFNRLGLVVIDEQHRFGVVQRAALVKSAMPTGGQVVSGAVLPHFLSMSATPIPRTLTLAIFGDLDLSIIDELPSGRKTIITKIVAPANRGNAYAFIRGQVKKGRQVFVICPRIEPQEIGESQPITFDRRRNLWNEAKTVKEEYERLAHKIFPDLRVAALHGKMKSKEKEAIMREFKDKKHDILVSTSVIEVGVDVPNATIMMIEGADRFGLAQLYQFRGRVGRGEHQSFCLLFTDASSKTTHDRLRALLEAKNGFELAEKDLAIRGPGQFLGESQAGMPDIAMRALQNMELLKESRSAAEKIISKSSDLKKYPALLAKVNEFRQTIHLE